MERIGELGTCVYVVDDVFLYPDNIRRLGDDLANPIEGGANFYPGLQYNLPKYFYDVFDRWLNGLGNTNPDLDIQKIESRGSGYFSIVATRADQLSPIQTIPHFDTTDSSFFALVIYLCSERFGGTSFYRHRASGVEAVTRETEPRFRASLRSEIKRPSLLERRYMNGGDGYFEKTFSIPLRYNRMAFYPACLLHAADIDAHYPGVLGASERRFTLTSLCQMIGANRRQAAV